jgi:hypothetical protein
MRAGYNYNKMRKYSMTVGGLRNVYGGKAEVTLPTGYNMALKDMPPVGNVLPAGTPFGCDDFAKTAQPHYAFAVNAVVETTATQVQVKKDFEGTRARVGMVLMPLPNNITDLDYTIDDSNADYDVLTLSAAVGTLAVDDILVEASAVGSGATIKVIPTATSFADIPCYGDEQTQLVDLVHICNVIYARRCAPVHPMIRNYMNTHGYFVRFYDGL